MRWPRIVSITAAGMTRAWRFLVGIFQGSPLGPRIYLYQEVKYMDKVRRPVTGIPDVECRGG